MARDTRPVNLHTFEAVLKFRQLLSWYFWSNSTKYLTVSILGSYVFFRFCFIISHKLDFSIFVLKIACIVPLTKSCLKYSKVQFHLLEIILFQNKSLSSFNAYIIIYS